eukprot:PhF_6_TR10249/c2_g1_i1/m.15892/K05765/CFL; cofilin
MSAGISGIAVADECMVAFDEIKKKKAYRYVLFSIKDDKAVAVESKGDRSVTYAQFVEGLPKDKPAYIVFDFEYPKDGVTVSKLVFISWIPDIAKVKSKMMYASTKDSIKSKIEGGLVEIQATDLSEISPEFVLSKVASSK